MLKPQPRPAARALSVSQLFERQAARTPDAVAVEGRGRRFSYRDLDAGANRVAHALRREGLGREDLVGVALRRSPELVCALLGIWKAGCAYVPLDPAYPVERLSFMIRDSGIALLLSDGSVDGAGTRTLRAGEGWIETLPDGGDMPAPCPAAADLAYVMYTSGSTGRPKGAMITHAGLANYLCWAVDAYGLEPGGSVPVHSPLSFDLTVTSLYAPLLAGAGIELLDEGEGVDALIAALRARPRSMVKLTPSHLELLNQELGPGELAGLTNVLVIGGEQLAAEQIAPWRRQAPATRLFNEYGPTETVVGCCVHEVGPDDPRQGPIAIGKPVANMRMHVVDNSLRPLPVGVAGELCIGGVGVARGYLNRPDLTGQRFIPDPFSQRPDARLYRSGDTVRWNGVVFEYLGRTDDQVKIRGHRVEPGEVEAALGSHPKVRSCAVLACEGGAGAELVGFAVPRQGESPTPPALLEFLRGRLPAWLVPVRCLVIDALPLTPNGKVDRGALRAMAAAGPAPGAAVPARNAGEVLVLDAFRAVFGREDIGVFDDFFDIGGRSLMAVRLMAALRAATGLELPLRSLYEHATPARLAEAIEALRWSGIGVAGADATGRTQASF